MKFKIEIKKGDKFNRLTFLGDTIKKGRRYYHKCICDCGNIKYIEHRKLTSGGTKSCGCIQKEKAKEYSKKNFTRHGMSKTILYRKYIKMRERCNYKKGQYYKDYGGRGIECERKTFEDFCNDMGKSFEEHIKKYGIKDTTLDRIDVNGNYSKTNCIRSTQKDQANNRRNNRILTYKGKNYTLQQLSDYVGINRKTLLNRLERGWDIDRACEEQVFYGHLYNINNKKCK